MPIRVKRSAAMQSGARQNRKRQDQQPIGREGDTADAYSFGHKVVAVQIRPPDQHGSVLQNEQKPESDDQAFFLHDIEAGRDSGKPPKHGGVEKKSQGEHGDR